MPRLDLADDLHLGDLVRPDAPLVDDGEIGVEALGEGTGPFHAAGIGRDDRDVVAAEPLAEMAEEDRRGVHVVDRDVEEPLDLARVEIDGEHPRGTGGGDEVRDELGADRYAGRDFAVLAGVAVVRDDRRDALGGRALERVQHQQQLHQVVVAGRTRRLHDEDVAPAHVVGDLDLDLAVAESPDLRVGERHPEMRAQRVRQRPVRVAREYLDLVLHRPEHTFPASWAGRSRTFAAGSKVRCLTSLATAQDRNG